MKSSFTISEHLDKNKVFIISKSQMGSYFSPLYHQSLPKKIQNTKKLKDIAFINPFRKQDIASKDDLVPYIGLPETDEHSRSIVEVVKRPYKEVVGRGVINKDDILFARIEPSIFNKKYIFADDLKGFDYAFTSTEFYIIKAKEVNQKFLFYTLFTDYVYKQVIGKTTGSTGRRRLDKGVFENLLIPVPPKATQEKIVQIMDNAYLLKKQNETEAEKLLASIDDYLLGELGIKLPSQPENSLKNRIFYTSLKEISGGRFDPKLYSSYVQSLLKCLVKGKYSFKTLKSLTTHSASGDWGFDENDKINKDEYTECLVVRATEFDNKSNLILDGKRAKYRLINNSKLNSLDVKTNDLLLEKSGGSENQPVGRIAILDQEIVENHKICFSNFIHKIRVDKNSLLPQYAFNYLKVIHNIKITDAMQSQTNGIRNLIIAEYLNLPIPLPPLPKQQEIANHITQIRNQAQLLKEQANIAIKQANQEIEQILLSN